MGDESTAQLGRNIRIYHYCDLCGATVVSPLWEHCSPQTKVGSEDKSYVPVTSTTCDKNILKVNVQLIMGSMIEVRHC